MERWSEEVLCFLIDSSLILILLGWSPFCSSYGFLLLLASCFSVKLSCSFCGPCMPFILSREKFSFREGTFFPFFSNLFGSKLYTRCQETARKVNCWLLCKKRLKHSSSEEACELGGNVDVGILPSIFIRNVRNTYEWLQNKGLNFWQLFSSFHAHLPKFGSRIPESIVMTFKRDLWTCSQTSRVIKLQEDENVRRYVHITANWSVWYQY